MKKNNNVVKVILFSKNIVLLGGQPKKVMISLIKLFCVLYCVIKMWQLLYTYHSNKCLVPCMLLLTVIVYCTVKFCSKICLWWGTLSVQKFKLITLSLKMQKIINYEPHQKNILRQIFTVPSNNHSQQRGARR